MRGSIRAVICDVYGTLLEVRSGPADPDPPWRRLCEASFGRRPSLEWHALTAAIDVEIRKEHATARASGIPHPEVAWEALMIRVLPGLAALGGAERGEFLFRHAGIRHQVRAMPGAREAIDGLRDSGVLVGIASNAQPYTVRELEVALAEVGGTLASFVPELRCWSFECGFGKPDPHVFRLLGARLRARGIAPGEILMVGDRPDNDLEPARAQGWRTWRWAAAAATGGGSEPGGDWEAFRRWWEAMSPTR